MRHATIDATIVVGSLVKVNTSNEVGFTLHGDWAVMRRVMTDYNVALKRGDKVAMDVAMATIGTLKSCSFANGTVFNYLGTFGDALDEYLLLEPLNGPSGPFQLPTITSLYVMPALP